MKLSNDLSPRQSQKYDILFSLFDIRKKYFRECIEEALRIVQNNESRIFRLGILEHRKSGKSKILCPLKRLCQIVFRQASLFLFFLIYK